MQSGSVYHRVTAITEDYLGPASGRFIDRIVENHLSKHPTQLSASDMPKLITWVRFAVGVVTDDPKVIDEYTRRLSDISTKQKQTAAE